MTTKGGGGVKKDPKILLRGLWMTPYVAMKPVSDFILPLPYSHGL